MNLDAQLAPEVLKPQIVERAKSLGFDDCRIAGSDEAAHAEAYRDWIEDGCHGEMGWLARNVDRRTRPQEVLPGAKSMIVLAMNYFVSGEPTGRGQFARYAWGDDYHDLIEKKLKEFNVWLEEIGGRQRYYVDTGPVLERDFASDSGLGWNGKSTVQIHRKLGTWFFLAEILTTLEIPRDEPIPNHCGSCTSCIDCCPTDAITEPHRVDARKCISYLTIEHRGSIPDEFRRAIGDRIYGCDDCLSVCPWNRFAQASQEAAFAAREFVTGWDLRDFLALDDEGFRQLFRKSPVKRTKRRGFLRNVCVALGNVGTEDDLPALKRATEDPEPLIVEHALWAISEIENRSRAS
ncbi:MAG: epoxyqueuosine reductase [Verrucomicrobiales bacterium]|jgi:epoxyqueuosine reductase